MGGMDGVDGMDGMDGMDVNGWTDVDGGRTGALVV